MKPAMRDVASRVMLEGDHAGDARGRHLVSLRRDWHMLSLVALLAVSMVFQAYDRGHLALGAWDESVHAIVAQHLALHPLVPTFYETGALSDIGTYYWTSAHVWLHVPAFGMWASALSMRLLGGTPFALRLPGLLFIGIGMIVTYVLGQKLYGPLSGLLGAAFVGLAPYPLMISQGYMFGDITDTPLSLFVPLTILLLVQGYRSGQRRWFVLAGASQGICYLDKGGIALAPTGVALALCACDWILPAQEGWKPVRLRGLLPFLASMLVVAAPYNLYLRQAFPLESAAEASAWTKSFLTNVEVWGQPPDEHFTMYLFAMYGPALALLLLTALVAVAVVALFRRSRADVVVVIWIAALYIPLSVAVTKTPNVTYAAGPAFGFAVARFTTLGLSARNVLARASTTGVLAGCGITAALIMLGRVAFRTVDYQTVLPERLLDATLRDRLRPYYWELRFALIVAALYIAVVLAAHWYNARPQTLISWPFSKQELADPRVEVDSLRRTLLALKAPPRTERWLMAGVMAAVVLVLGAYWACYDAQVVGRPQVDERPAMAMGAFLEEHTPPNATIVLISENTIYDNAQNQLMFWAHRDVYSTLILQVTDICALSAHARRADSPLFVVRTSNHMYSGRPIGKAGEWTLYMPACS